MKYVFMFTVALVSIIAMFVTVFLIYFQGPNSSASHLQYFGQVGDFFGGMLNPVLAFASFMALLYTIRIQSKQLDVSTNELEATRQELKASREAQQRSSAALDGQLRNLRIQRVEDFVFKFLAHNVFKVKHNTNCIQQISISLTNLSDMPTQLRASTLMTTIISNELVRSNFIESFGYIVEFIQNEKLEEMEDVVLKLILLELRPEHYFVMALYCSKFFRDELREDSSADQDKVDKFIETVMRKQFLKFAATSSETNFQPARIYLSDNPHFKFGLPIIALGYESQVFGF